MAVSAATASPFTVSTSPSEEQMSSTQYAVVVAVAIGYPVLMLLLVLGCRRLLLHCGPFAGLSYEEVYLNMSSTQRTRLICIWIRYKIGGCCCSCVDSDEHQTPSGGRNTTDDVISFANEYNYNALTSASMAPPSYDVALTMPRAYSVKTVKFADFDGNLYEFSMSVNGTTGAWDAPCDPPRLVVEAGQSKANGDVPVAVTRPDPPRCGWPANLTRTTRRRSESHGPTSGFSFTAQPSFCSANARPITQSSQLLTASGPLTRRNELTQDVTQQSASCRTSTGRLLDLPVAINVRDSEDGISSISVRL